MSRVRITNKQVIELIVGVFERAGTSTELLRRTLANLMIDYMRMSRLIEGSMTGEEAAEFIERVHMNAAEVLAIIDINAKAKLKESFQLVPFEDYMDEKHSGD